MMWSCSEFSVVCATSQSCLWWDGVWILAWFESVLKIQFLSGMMSVASQSRLWHYVKMFQIHLCSGVMCVASQSNLWHCVKLFWINLCSGVMYVASQSNLWHRVKLFWIHLCSGVMYVASQSNLWRLQPVPASQQIRDLLQNKQFELALKLAVSPFLFSFFNCCLSVVL